MRFKPNFQLEIADENNFALNISKIEAELCKYVNVGRFNSFDNTEIYYEYFLTEESKGSVIIVHGLSEFTKKFYEFIYILINQGYNVFIYDQRCHGLSERLTKHRDLLHVDSFNDYVRDLEFFIDNIVLKIENKPLYLYSHSMGGAICSLYLAKHSNKIKKAIMSAPMFEPTVGKVSVKLALASVKIAKFFCGKKGRFAVSKDFNPEITYKTKHGSSRERFNYNMNLRRNNPMYQSTPMSIGWVHNSLVVNKQIFKKDVINNINCPILVFTAENDDTVRNDLQYQFANNVKNCELVVLKNTTHSVLASDKDTLLEVINKTLNFLK